MVWIDNCSLTGIDGFLEVEDSEDEELKAWEESILEILEETLDKEIADVEETKLELELEFELKLELASELEEDVVTILELRILLDDEPLSEFWLEELTCLEGIVWGDWGDAEVMLEIIGSWTIEALAWECLVLAEFRAIMLSAMLDFGLKLVAKTEKPKAIIAIRNVYKKYLEMKLDRDL
jgi:hypothetical protein